MIGLIGGMSWRSTELYHRHLNEAAEAKGGLHANARSIIISLLYADLLGFARAGDWTRVGDMIGEALRQAEAAGATLGLMTAVTPHRLFDVLAAKSPIPLLHVLDPAIEALSGSGVTQVGLLGTSYTLDTPAFSAMFVRAGLRIIRPSAQQCQTLDGIIQSELTTGLVNKLSNRRVASIARDLVERGAEVILLACTELPLLDWHSFDAAAVIDVTRLHAEAALKACR